jgi:hypothetical protein
MNWPKHQRVERRAVRMHAMLDRLDVDPVSLSGGGLIYCKAGSLFW